jgi:hypothetical protein
VDLWLGDIILYQHTTSNGWRAAGHMSIIQLIMALRILCLSVEIPLCVDTIYPDRLYQAINNYLYP